MEVDEAGGDDEIAGVECFVGGGADFIGRRDFGYAAVAQEDVHGLIDLGGRVDQVAVLDQEGVVYWAGHREIPGSFFSADSREFVLSLFTVDTRT